MSLFRHFSLFASSMLAAGTVLAASPSPDKFLDCTAVPPRQVGTVADDQVLAMQRDGAGNLLVAGFEGGIVGREAWPTGDARGFVEKYAATGPLLWRREIDTAGADVVDAMTLADNGEIVVAGRTTGAVAGGTQRGKVDLFVAVYSPEGDLRTIAQAGDERPQHPVGVAMLPSGDIVVAGYDDVHVETNYVVDWENGFLVRFARPVPGRLQERWWIRSPIPASDFITAIAPAGAGSEDVYVAMLSVSSWRSGGGTHVARVGADGHRSWKRLITRQSMDIVSGLVTDAGGRLFAAGSTLTNLGGPALGHSDGFVLELDPHKGKKLWTTRMHNPDPFWMSDLKLAANGEIHAVGTAYLAEDAQLEIFRQYAGGIVVSDRGQELRQWHTPAVTDPVWSLELRAAPGSCVDDLLIGGAVDGALPGGTARGGYDRVLLPPSDWRVP